MKVTINGLTIEGSDAQVLDLVKKMGFDSTLYHYSETKGKFIPIADMDTAYIANCIAKMYREKITNPSLGSSYTETIMKIFTNPHFYALLSEYMNREDRND